MRQSGKILIFTSLSCMLLHQAIGADQLARDPQTPIVTMDKYVPSASP